MTVVLVALAAAALLSTAAGMEEARNVRIKVGQRDATDPQFSQVVEARGLSKRGAMRTARDVSTADHGMARRAEHVSRRLHTHR